MYFIIDPAHMRVIDALTSIEDATAVYDAQRLAIGDVILAEVMLDSRDCAATKIPAELARAIGAWNAMCDRLPVKLPKVKAASQFLSPYRRWKRENPGRSYLLEKLVEDVSRQSWCHSWITFGWLFGKKNGEPNSEKLRNGKFDNTARRNDARISTRDDEFSPTER
jgi:hypothetical protein